MFGYVLPVKGELKVRDFEAYRAQYCGVCKQLGKSYGTASRFLLNYDLVLVSVLTDALSGEAGATRCEGCFANPLSKRPTCHDTAGLRLASDALALLSYHKLADNLQDETLPKRIGYGTLMPLASGIYRRARAARPALEEAIKREMQNQLTLEREGCDIVDKACEPTAHMCAAIFSEISGDERQQKILSRLGLFCGQVNYLLDAAEDYEKDQKSGSYNVFIKAGLSQEEAVEAARRRCRMAAGEIALCYNLLDLKQYKDILDNIFFLGLPAAITNAGVKAPQRRTGHGQIQSV